MSILLILGNDKLAQKAAYTLSIKGFSGNYDMAIDKSSILKRIIHLIYKKRVSLLCFIKMFYAELLRGKTAINKKHYSIFSNDDLYNILTKRTYKKIVLFRAGLIINQKCLETGIPFYNIHCADIPKYAGLCSIYKAIENSDYKQKACIHKVTSTIDDALEILDYEYYFLEKDLSYKNNESIAYDAGIKLLLRNLKKHD